MSREVYALLDDLAARRLLRGQLPGDYKLIDLTDLEAEVPVRVYALVLSWSAEDEMCHEW